MDRIVEQLVRLNTSARRRGDEVTALLTFARLMAMAKQPGFHRSFDRALAVVDWR